MKPTFTATLFAIALSFGAAATQASENVAAVGGASSVADMLQRKHESELRAQLVTAGRWDEVQKLDDARAQRLQEQREQRISHLNERLAHSASGPLIDAHVLECNPDTLHVK